MKRFIYASLALFMLALTAGSCRREGAPAEHYTAVDSLPMLIMQVRQCARLYTTEYRIHKIVTYDDELRLKGSIFDPNILYERLPNEIAPFDYETYGQNPATFEMVTTNCLTGRAEYLEEKHDRQRMMAIVKASSSLPYVSQVTMVDGTPMLDGGIVDSIPVVRAIETGHPFNVVVMTRNLGYRSSEHDVKIPRMVYKRYPRLRVALSHRVEAYNQQLDLIERMEQWGEIVVIRPVLPMEVDRICRDPKKLERLYEEGFQEGERFCLSVGR